MAVSKRLRYEILRRDNHTCRYCGGTAPDVSLRVDHVVPVALGGSDEPSNLVASCHDCNAGKTSTPPDATVVEDVTRDAMRWARALEQAADMHRNARDITELANKDFVWEVVNEWPGDKVFTRMDKNYDTTILRFRDLGMSMEDMKHAIEQVPTHRLFGVSRWKYFCGVCWSIIRERQEIARGLIESEDC